MVEGVDHVVGATGAAQELQGPVGDDLVGVHVRRGAGPALDGVDDELVHQPSRADLLAYADDRCGDVRGQEVEVAVGLRGGLLDGGQCGDQVGELGDGRPGDREVLHGPHGVHAVVGVGGDLLVSDQVVLDAYGHLLLLALLRAP